MTASIRKTDAISKAMLRFCFDLAEAVDRKDLADTLAAEVGQIEARPPGIDTRGASWTDERRKQLGERVSAAWAAKREAKGLGDTFYQFKYADEKPELLKGKEALAKASGLSTKTVANKLSASPDGFVIRQGGINIIFARSEEGRDKLAHALYNATGNPDDIITLASKKARRF